MPDFNLTINKNVLDIIFFPLNVDFFIYQNEPAFDQIITDSTFKSYIFKLRAKMETYNVSHYCVEIFTIALKVTMKLNVC